MFDYHWTNNINMTVHSEIQYRVFKYEIIGLTGKKLTFLLSIIFMTIYLL